MYVFKLTNGLRSSVCCLISCILLIQSRIFPSSSWDKNEHIEVDDEALVEGIDDVVEDTMFGDVGAAFFDLTSPSAENGFWGMTILETLYLSFKYNYLIPKNVSSPLFRMLEIDKIDSFYGFWA